MAAEQAKMQRKRANSGMQAAEFDEALTGRVVPEERRRSRFAIGRPPATDGHDLPSKILARELARSRRYGHPLALIGIIPAADPDQVPKAGAEIRRCVRTVDSVWTSQAGVLLLLPESDRDDGEALLGRLRLEAAAGIEGAVTHIAVFPADGLTAGALFEIARGGTAPQFGEPPASFRGSRLEASHARSRALPDSSVA